MGRSVRVITANEKPSTQLIQNINNYVGRSDKVTGANTLLHKLIHIKIKSAGRGDRVITVNDFTPVAFFIRKIRRRPRKHRRLIFLSNTRKETKWQNESGS